MIEGSEYILDEGDVLAFLGDRKHSYKNLADTESQGISIVALHYPDFVPMKLDS
jgi:quercetin dioxygenase-like cupin family protein